MIRSSFTTLLHQYLNCNISCLDMGFSSLFKYFVDPVVSWFEEVARAFVVFLLFSCNLIGILKQAIGFCILIKLPHWLGKRRDLEQKIIRFVNKAHK